MLLEELSELADGETGAAIFVQDGPSKRLFPFILPPIKGVTI